LTLTTLTTVPPAHIHKAIRRRVPIMLMAVLAGIYIYLLALLIPYWLANNLLKGDGAGHLMLTEFTSTYLLPFGSGWCDRIWGGFPAGQLYPPLFHIVAGALSHLIGPVAAIKILVTISWLAIPAFLTISARALAGVWEAQSHALLEATLLVALWAAVNIPSSFLQIEEALGSNLESTIGNGMAPSALGLACFTALLAVVITRGRRAPVLLAFILGVTILSHAVWGLVGAGLCMTAALVDIRRSPRQGLALSRWALSALLAFTISGMFAIPFITYRNLLNTIYLPSFWSIPWWLFIATTGALAIVSRRHIIGHWRTLLLLGSALVLCIGTGDLLELDFHFYRLTIPVVMIFLPLLTVLLFQPWLGNTGTSRLLRLRRWSNFLMVTLLAGLVHLAGPVFPSGNPDIPPILLHENSRAKGRIVTLSDTLHSPGYMALPYAVMKAGGAVSHGISVESATNASAIFGLMSRLSSSQHVWGVRMQDNPVLRVPDPNGSLVLRQLQILGISHILSDRHLTIPGLRKTGEVFRFPNFLGHAPATLRKLRAGYNLTQDGAMFTYHFHELKGPELVEAGLPMLGVPQDRFRDLSAWWFAYGGQAPVPVSGWQGASPARPEVHARLTGLSPRGDSMQITVATDAPETDLPVPVFVKTPFHPLWLATQSNGDTVPLFPAGTGMLLLAKPGQIKLEYQPGFAVWAGRVLTLLGLMLTLLAALRQLVARGPMS
jgi:hypothetical protein